ncbi:helix-turn-helix transcriptional regulator [Streptomyces sp. N50]|uniref:helix-turn-helix transcriptional regulator n=1 Tax=Streptomyces sp. N50 TaxID=3081765 RepID=UPI0029625A0C|nr:LuxR C-terminal-related transcriptional regulator [Streptomyces sp. N50]WOX15229.1 LuxR C-terminal-related transcriptional regulator [Streptomyces sp. N50]
MTETAYSTGWPGTGERPFHEGSAVYIPGRQDTHDERVPPDEVCLSLHSLELANLGVRRALVHEQIETILDAPDRRGHPYCMWLAILTLLYTGDLVAAYTACRRLAADPRWSGSQRHQELLTLMRARISLLSGDGVKTSALLSEALAHGLPAPLHRLAVAWLVEAHVLAGGTDTAHKVLLAHELAGRLDPGLPDVAYVLAARGTLRMATGQVQHALDDLISCGRILTAQNVANPAVIPWRSRAAFAALAARRQDLALALASDELTAARSWGAPRGIGIALHAVAVAGRGEDAVTSLEEAVELLGLAHARGELIHALHDLARLQTERGDPSAARSRLEAAFAVARESRNGLWPEQLKSALERHDLPVLTSQELRISELARAGYSNRQIAETLFLAVRTVEFHLSSVYRKLGVSGRRELRSALGAPPS